MYRLGLIGSLLEISIRQDFNEVSFFYVKFPTIVLLEFYAVEQFWTEEDTNKAQNAFRDGRR
jgi:hypothetical protein